MIDRPPEGFVGTRRSLLKFEMVSIHHDDPASDSLSNVSTKAMAEASAPKARCRSDPGPWAAFVLIFDQ
jgi:hypothetical protein